MTEPVKGSEAPDFVLPADGGSEVRLSDFRGKTVVLFFYPKDNTSGCTVEAIDFTALKPEFDVVDTIVLGMSPDSPKSHDKFKTKHGLTVGLVSDQEKETLQAYGVWVEKSMYGRKYMGVERSTFLIDPEGRIAEVWRKVKVPGHAQAVLEAAKKLRQNA
ncbi:peroxiredoxin [Nitratireductor aquimarinus]|uniref:peroxiredoxin n=1 Tax=Nitratireductor TaxID=245876 RepID=UPI0019D35D3C|nr:MULTISPECIES: peroxiredoxin [Nitratireductor]MBN7778142.1 peroxiredoxin [Nitratireductor pacificus]MBN7782464.1 peroxiredoxin [Nitratireductor pacificus]MBN7791271.1 peroxiredoxin [Nitratireductor aquimarinus]MBY6100351.1 peroxiredoxin [Nitratireductor aquimarinus]MCA1260809.1 peroxiredoxin [Nitratireductor aquimarinus]